LNKRKTESAKAVLLESIHPVAKSHLEAAAMDVGMRADSPAESELAQILSGISFLGIRSKTQVRKNLLQKVSDSLLAVGAFCIGTDQIDTRTSKLLGIPVFNAPHANTRSVAELVLAEMIMLARGLADKSAAAHSGKWIKSAEASFEVRGKILGIVGYGHIGSQVSILAEALGMKVQYFDIVKKLSLGNARSCQSLKDLLKNSDFVTLHVPDTTQTRGLMGAKEMSLMKKGSMLINASRGQVVDIPALVAALEKGDLGGAAIDVFPKEPSSNKEKFDSPLQGMANVVLTPHIGGSTLEAQKNIGSEVAESFVKYWFSGSTLGAVGFPQIDLPTFYDKPVVRVTNVHLNEPGVLGEINGIVSDFGANIVGQALGTDSDVGYMIMDLEKPKGKDSNQEAHKLVEQIQNLKRSLKTRAITKLDPSVTTSQDS
jgi:D-3-phosphoglycerate dehydrogenase / 2-oxoglutarate reductase